ncbi:MAG TPA: hypothetical protein VHU41_08445 [Thermoanaerobaculia bacterium]|nr:hypothetical protein [Thermoanaerobaculia bacterium]
MSKRCTVVYQNLSDNHVSDVLVLLRNTRASAGIAPPIAWQVLRGGRRSLHKFVHTTDTQIEVTTNGGLLMADALERAIYAVKERGDQSVLVRTGVTVPNETIVLNDLPAPDGIDVTLCRDGKPVMMRRAVPYGAQAEFGLESTIWIGLVNDVVEGEALTRDVLSRKFTPIDLTGLSSLTFGLYGSREQGYSFKTISKTIQAPDYFFVRRTLTMPRSAFGIS